MEIRKKKIQVCLRMCACVYVCVRKREINGDIEGIWDREQMGQVTAVATHTRSETSHPFSTSIHHPVLEGGVAARSIL